MESSHIPKSLWCVNILSLGPLFGDKVSQSPCLPWICADDSYASVFPNARIMCTTMPGTAPSLYENVMQERQGRYLEDILISKRLGASKETAGEPAGTISPREKQVFRLYKKIKMSTHPLVYHSHVRHTTFQIATWWHQDHVGCSSGKTIII